MEEDRPKYEWYPKDGSDFYYVEYHQWPGEPERWALFERNYFHETEVHPWRLDEGEVAQEQLISMHTKKFLEFLVDSLNKNRAAAPKWSPPWLRK